MKKFTKILVCLLLCVFSLGFVACGDDDRTEEEKAFTYPSGATNSDIVGNRGMAVQKGNYIYYVNGFKAIDAEGREQGDSYTVGALMLMKLDSNGNIVTDEDGLLKDDYYITMSNRLCGFNVTSLYIAGDYLYFTSGSEENIEKDGKVDPVWAQDYVEFYKIKLDKSSSPELIYQANVLCSNLKFEYYSSGNNVYILCYEKGESLEEVDEDEDKNNNALVRVDGNGNVSLVANEVAEKGYIFAKESNQVFYVKAEGEDLNKQYKLYQYDVVSNTSTYYGKTESSSFNISAVSGGNVYVVANDELQESTIANKSSFKTIIGTASDFTDQIYVDNGIVMAVVDNSINFFGDNYMISKTITDEAADKINVIGFVNGCLIYYTTGDNGKVIKSVSYSNACTNQPYEFVELGTVSSLNTSYFDLQEDYLYFYNKIGNNEYLNRVKVYNNFDKEIEMVGVYLEADAPELETEEAE